MDEQFNVCCIECGFLKTASTKEAAEIAETLHKLSYPGHKVISKLVTEEEPDWGKKDA